MADRAPRIAYGWSPVDKVPLEEPLDTFEPPTGSVALLPGGSRAIRAVNNDLRYLQQSVPEIQQISADLEFLTTRPRLRRAGIWNPGPFGAATYAPQDDVAFITQLLDQIEASLKERMGEIRAPNGDLVDHVIDRRRRFLMGYSMGGMLCYHLIASMAPGTWAAFHAMSTTCGGVLHRRDGPIGFVNRPPSGPPVSLYHHHGGSELAPVPPIPRKLWKEWNDLGVAPGPEGVLNLIQPPERIDELMGDVDVDVSVTSVPDTRVARTMSEAEALDEAHAYQSMAVAAEEFALHNGCVNLPTIESGMLDRIGTTQARRLTRSRQYPSLVTDNPVVVEPRDARMNHTNYFETEPANKYIDVFTIWDWLQAHPKTQ